MVLYPNKLPESERVCSGICKGDMITIYSKRGTEKKQKISNGNINHILYWKEDNSIWEKNTTALLVKVADFTYKSI